MEEIKPVYIKALIAAIAVFVAGVSLLLSDLYIKVGQLERDFDHFSGKCPAHPAQRTR